MIIANFMDSSLLDLRRKGVFDTVPDIYNPGRGYERVIHFTPHELDLGVADLLREHRIDIRVHHVGALQPLKFVRAVVNTWRSFGKDKVDLVRGRLPYMGSLIGGLAAWARGLPFVVSLGGDNRIPQESDGYYYGSRAISYAIEKAVLKLATRIIVPNRFTARYVERIIGMQAAQERCVVIGWMSQPVPSEADDDANVMAGLGLAADRPLLPVIGFINRYKFSHVLFDMLEVGPIRDAQGRPAIVCFAGDGPMREEGQRRFQGRGDVAFLGWQPRSVVHALLRRASVSVIPMSGFVLLEAASLGKPVVTSSVEWHAELVEAGRSGLLVDPGDPREWHDAIVRMLANPDVAQQMGNRLKNVYWSRFSPAACAAAEHRLYEALTGKRVMA